ncbi:VENN motif pre-toxin domain-containing protein [Vagococcus sp. WN89Y]|uniref:VENN motif pre-toxin domain-containing protein n=1 Tax=Vagococcus sp. WN89Y TaxID=3457258 RepID=UPI003FCC9157
MIASDAEAAKNRLSTDTLGWSDIRNKAESGGSQFGLNVSGGVAQNSQSGGYQATTGETAKEGQSGGYKGTPGGLPSASLAHVSESDSSTTHSAVAAGDIIIRDPAKQQQNVADLSRDTANAHKALDNNFDKEAIKDKLEIQQQATALGTQAMTVYMDSKLDAAKKQVRDDMAARGELNGLSETEIESKVTASPEFKAVDKEYGIGSPFWTASSAMTGLLAGILGGNVQGGVAAGAAPVLAKLVKDAAGKNEAARIALHTVVSAALAKAQGGNATAGAIGGFVASAGAERFAGALYGKKADELTPDEKMVVLNLVAAVGAAGGGVAAGDTAGMVSAGNAARVEVENNFLTTGRPQEYTTQLKTCGNDVDCKQKIIKSMAKESADNIQHLKSCWDAGDQACVEAIAAKIELGDKAYQQLRIEDDLVGRAYQNRADWYADIIDKCAGKCGWLEAAVAKGMADGLTAAVYGALAGGSALKPGQTTATNRINVVKGITDDISQTGKQTELRYDTKTTKRSAAQIVIKNMTQSEAIANLSSNGYAKTISKDGTVTVMTKGEKVYRFYPKSTGGGVIGAESGIPSASVSVNGKIISKLRFPGEQ